MKASYTWTADRLDHHLVVVGVNHKVAPLEVRERLSFTAEHIPEVVKALVSQDTGIQVNSEKSSALEAVLVSTCNRSELYLYSEGCKNEGKGPGITDPQAYALNFLAAHAGMSRSALKKISYIHSGKAAAHHLLRVAAGLDLLVLGENEILGQVRDAAELAQKGDSCGPNLSALFRFAIQAGKRVRCETEIGRASLSVASVVAELAEQTFGSIHRRTALLVGAGKISSLTGRALVDAGLRCILVANRSFERAQKLAASLNGVDQKGPEQSAQAVRFDALAEHLKTADIVICSTGAPHIVLHLPTVAAALEGRQGRQLLIADLAVPRDVEPAIANLPGVTLVNIDDLKGLVEARHPLTLAVLQAAEAIVAQTLEEFCAWHEARRCAPLIRALQDKAQAICQAEIQRTLPRLGELSPKQQAMIEAMAQAIANRLLHDPIMHLKDPCTEALSDSGSMAKRGTVEEFADDAYQKWFEALFGLQVE